MFNSLIVNLFIDRPNLLKTSKLNITSFANYYTSTERHLTFLLPSNEFEKKNFIHRIGIYEFTSPQGLRIIIIQWTRNDFVATPDLLRTIVFNLNNLSLLLPVYLSTYVFWLFIVVFPLLEKWQGCWFCTEFSTRKILTIKMFLKIIFTYCILFRKKN